MKKIFLYLLFLATMFSASAQRDTNAAYLRFPTIPPFTLLKADSSTFTNKNLAKNKKTLIVYFSPDCDHCKHQTDSMLAEITKFRNIQIVMATYQPLAEMKAFHKNYGLSNYGNIKLGRDINFFFPPFFKIANLPFLILYDEKGKLIITFEGITQISKVLKAFSKPA